MFIGHFAVGFASKRLAPRTSLGALMLAPLFLDLLWPIFLAVGIEHVQIVPGDTAFTPLDLHDYPWSHSLLMAVVWSILVSAAWLVLRRDRRGAAVIAAGVFSHWVLDWLTHRPDMPLYPGSSTSVGLGLWNHPTATIVIESAMFVAGVASYATFTRARDGVGRWAFWAYAGLLAVFYVMTAQGKPPPNVTALIVVAFAGWLFVPWAAWFDAHRAET